MLAHHVDDRNFRTSRVVKISKTIAQTWSEMKKGARRFFRHSSVTVGGSRYHTFEQPKHAAHFRNAIECGNDVHFGSAWV
jgi:hypothetical protein